MIEREEGYMQQHLCECMIDINGEKLQVIYRGPTNPVPWPEIKVLMEIHGETSVYDIKPVALGERDLPNREKERMVREYGRDTVEAVYAGKSFLMEWFVPGWPINPAKASKALRKQEIRPPRVLVKSPDDDASVDARI